MTAKKEDPPDREVVEEIWDYEAEAVYRNGEPIPMWEAIEDEEVMEAFLEDHSHLRDS